MLSGRKYRLALTAEQTSVCEEFGNICRGVWNTALDQRRQYRRRGAWMNYVPQAAELADAKKGSVNRRKTVAAMNRIMGRITDRRADFCAQTANRIATRNALVVLEDLKTKNMTASAKGTVAEPGKRVAQKRGLNRAILDKGWHRLELALTNAVRYTGTRLVKVNPAYTSQMCNRCGHVDAKNRESQAVFECTACGHRDHADVKAAKNVLSAAGHAVPACGDFGAAQSVKQEPAPPQGTPHQLAFGLAGIPRLQPRGGSQQYDPTVPPP